MNAFRRVFRLFVVCWAATLSVQGQEPTSFNLNSLGWLTPVKNQGNLGTCWAFADTTTFQSGMLRVGLVESVSAPSLAISPWHLATANGNITDLVPSTVIGPRGEVVREYDGWGGYNDFSVGYWSRGRGQWVMRPTAGTTPAGGGSVLISDHPLNRYPFRAASEFRNLSPFVSPASQRQSRAILETSVNFDWNGVVADLPAYQASLKEALQKYGALAVYVKADNPETDRGNEVFFDPNRNATADHAVTLVGWDDDYTVKIRGKTYVGAWLIQNSWGAVGGRDPVTGNKGYYWVPFGDISRANVKQATAFVPAERGQTAPTVLQNQIFVPTKGFGEIARIGSLAGTPSLVTNRTIVPSNSLLGSFAVFQTEGGTSFDLTAYDSYGARGPTGKVVIPTTRFTLNSDGSGYNMVDLPEPVRVKRGKSLYFLIDFGSSYNTPVAVDTRTVRELPAEFGTHQGLSWFSNDGINWIDTTSISIPGQGGGLFFFKVFRLREDLINPTIDSRYDFTVDGAITAGTGGVATEILGLNFFDGGVLSLDGPLTVTGGRFGVDESYELGIIRGSQTLTVPVDFSKQGDGTLRVMAQTEIAGDARVHEGWLEIGGNFDVSRDFFQTGLNSGTYLQTHGRFTVGGDATIEGGNFEVAGVTQVHGDLLQNGVKTTLEVLDGGQVQVDGNAVLRGGSTTIGQGRFGARTISLDGSLVRVEAGGRAEADAFARVNAGELIVNGVFTSPTLLVNPAGTVSGIGTFNSNFLNSGLLAPGQSPGTLTINGNFTQNGDGVLAVEIAGIDDYDRLSINGNAALGGALSVSTFGSYQLEWGQQYDDVVSAQQIRGAFDAIVMPEGLRGRTIEDGGTLDLLVAPASYTQAAATNNQLGVANALDAFIPATSGDRYTVSLALDQLSASEYPEAFESISPAYYQSLSAMTVEQAIAQGVLMQQRFRAVQLGATGFQSIGLPDSELPAEAGKAVMDPKSEVAFEPVERMSRWSAWALGNGTFSNTSGTSGMSGYGSNGGGFLVGADYRWSDLFVTGVYSGYQGTSTEYDDGGSTSTNSVRFGGYATFGGATGFFANTMVGGGATSYRLRRPIDFGSIDRTAEGEPGGWDFETMLMSGYNWQIGNFNFGIAGGGQYTLAAIDAFSETGADSLNLTVDRQDVNSIRSQLGGQLAYLWQASSEILVVPNASMYWQHEFLQDPEAISASLAGARDAEFSYTTTAPARDNVLASVGIVAHFGDRWTTNVDYTANFGRQDFVSHMISTGVNISF